MRVLILGVGKSGTTALACAVRGALGDVPLLFEPTRPLDVPDPAVAKVVLNQTTRLSDAFYAKFHRKILIIRDPRDVVISKALYRVYNNPAVWSDQARLDRYVEALRAKEADPRSISICELNRIFKDLVGRPIDDESRLVGLFGTAISFHDRWNDCLVYRYEQLVRQDYTAVEEYLGVRIAGEAKVPDELSRVVRSRRAGNWRHWFCDEDVAHYRDMLRAFMERYRYDDDWALSNNPRIAPDEASSYVLKLADQARAVSLKNSRENR